MCFNYLLGIMSFADHHNIPGKKFWTWGNGPRGRMWDKILTDDDGPVHRADGRGLFR